MLTNIVLVVVVMAFVIKFFAVPQVKNVRKVGRHPKLGMLGVAFFCVMFLGLSLVSFIDDDQLSKVNLWVGIASGLLGFAFMTAAGWSRKK